MNANTTALTTIALAGVLFVGCARESFQSTDESNSNHRDLMTQDPVQKQDTEVTMKAEDYMRIAREAIEGKMRVQEEATVEVRYDGEHVIVTFGWMPPPGIDRSDVLGPDYAAQVTIHRYSGKVLKILGG